jgi:hypothetical protein
VRNWPPVMYSIAMMSTFVSPMARSRPDNPAQYAAAARGHDLQVGCFGE